MTHDDHQRERRDFWKAACVAAVNSDLEPAGERADYALESFDKRFPAPSAAAPVEPDQSAMGMAVSSLILDQTAELASLRQKARLWDAVATPQSIRLHQYADGPWFCTWMHGMQTKTTGAQESAAAAVEAAIATGALK